MTHPDYIKKIFVIESHPIQYKAPVYKEVSKLLAGQLCVVYSTDAPVRGGFNDREFGQVVKWDTPLLEGYENHILDQTGNPDLRRALVRSGEAFGLY